MQPQAVPVGVEEGFRNNLNVHFHMLYGGCPLEAFQYI
jgi:hypothetical protein